MDVIKIFCIIISLYFLLCGIQLIINGVLTTKEIKKYEIMNLNTDTISFNTKYIIIIAALREQNIIENTMEHFQKFLSKGYDIQVVITTSKREREQLNENLKFVKKAIIDSTDNCFNEEFYNRLKKILNNEACEEFKGLSKRVKKDELLNFVNKNTKLTTFDITKELSYKLNSLNKQETFICYETPEDRLGKVGQVNYAFQQWKNQFGNSKGVTYIAVYDADSRPDEASFKIVNEIINKRSKNNEKLPDIFQQVSSYCNNINQLSGLTGLIATADALAQTRWAMSFEYQLYKRYNKKFIKNKVRPLAYCIGHGCFINKNVLINIGGFPTQSKTDDLALGYLASAKGLEILPVAALDFCEVAPQPIISIKQSKFWFSGSKRFYKDILFYIKKFNINLSWTQKIVFKIQGFLRNFFWAWRANLSIISLSIALAFKSMDIFYMLLTSIFIYVQLAHIFAWIQLRILNKNFKLSFLKAILSCIIAPIVFFIRGIGPFIAFFSKEQSETNYKVER